jgi:hypothetical protein
VCDSIKPGGYPFKNLSSVRELFDLTVAERALRGMAVPYLGELSSVLYDLGLDSNLFYCLFNVLMSRQGCTVPFLGIITFSLGGRRGGLPYLGEFSLVFHDVVLHSNLFYSPLNVPMSRQGRTIPFLRIITFTLGRGE